MPSGVLVGRTVTIFGEAVTVARVDDRDPDGFVWVCGRDQGWRRLTRFEYGEVLAQVDDEAGE